MPFQVTVRLPDRVLYEAKAERLVLPAVDGEMGILPRHGRMSCLLGSGPLKVTEAGGETVFFVSGGIARVLPGEVQVLALEGEPAAEIDPLLAKETLSRARSMPASTPEEIALKDKAVAAAEGRVRTGRRKKP